MNLDPFAFIEQDEYFYGRGGGSLEDGRRISNNVQASEKIYQSFTLETTNPGGHSSLPTKDNAIYHLADALLKIQAFDFPVNLNEVTRAYFERTAALVDPENALPQRAQATVNCRILPDETPADVYNTLVRVVDNDHVSITPISEGQPSPPSPLTPELLEAIERITEQMWPDVGVLVSVGEDVVFGGDDVGERGAGSGVASPKHHSRSLSLK